MERYQIQSKDCLLQVYACGSFDSDTAIVFLHGGPGSGAQAILELPAFRSLEKDALCIHFDQRGSGASNYDLKKGLSIDTITRDVQRVIQDTKAPVYMGRLLWRLSGCLVSGEICAGADRLYSELTGNRLQSFTAAGSV